MEESFIPSSEFETANNAVNNILGQPVEEIEITDILPPLNDITDSNKVFKGKLSVLFVDMRKSTDLTDELKSKKMVKVYCLSDFLCFCNRSYISRLCMLDYCAVCKSKS